MQDVVIVGVGGLGRECAQWLEDVNADRATFRVAGFVDDDASKHGTISHDLPVLGPLDWLASHRGMAAILGVGSPSAKRKIVQRLRGHVTGFPVLCHPRTVVGRYVELGEGCVVSPGVILTTDIRIGSFVTFNFDLTVGHDSVVGDYATLSPGVHLSGYSKIGEGVDLGAGAVTIPSIEVGAWSIVGAGAVIAESLPANCTAVGVPARVIKSRPDGWHL